MEKHKKKKEPRKEKGRQREKLRNPNQMRESVSYPKEKKNSQ